MSSKDLYRLANSAAIEPLINSWAAWSDLISPATYSLHLLNYQLELLSSYLNNPKAHVLACQDNKLLGGRFVDIPLHRAAEIRELRDRTNKDQADNIRFARAIIEAYEYLVREAKGQSIEPYYEKLPDVLRGYIELFYDYYSHPIVRFIESLLYESPYYKKELQSLRIIQQTRDDSRRFFLTTPRLIDGDQIDWRVPFEDPQVDEFFKLESTEQPLGYIRDLLGLSPAEEVSLLPFLSPEPASSYQPPDGSGIRIRYFGHACVLVEWNGVSILTDPFLGVMSKEGGIDHFTYNDLPGVINYALVTHGHHDHFVLESLLRLRHRIEYLVVPRHFGMFYTDLSLKLMAQKLGFKQVIELDTLESIRLPDGEITSVPFLGEHADLAHGKTGYVVRGGTERILFAADANCLDRAMYDHVYKIIGPIETVFLGMECVGAPLSWIYGALLPVKLPYSHDQSRRSRGCNSVAALNLLEAIDAKRIFVYAMGAEPWLQYSLGLGLSESSVQIKESNQLILKAREKGFIEARRLFGKFETYLNL
jgi:L-ascorbate metabolism protein UlaG (beta-lactamase superfamily)